MVDEVPAGERPVDDMPELRFEAGLPGFPDSHRFALVAWDSESDSPFSILTGLDVEGLEFLVVPPVAFFPDYVVEIDDDTAERLTLESADDALLLVIVNLADGAAGATANLRAPIIVNRHSRVAVQAVLDDASQPIRQPLFEPQR